MTSFKYLIYDMETIVNKPLLNRVLYAGQGLSDEEAFQKELVEVMADNKGRTFINPSFQKPVSIASIAVGADFRITRIGLLGGETKTAASMVRDFWTMVIKNSPLLVDFNGSGFDMRVLEVWAFHLGISIHQKYFAKFGPRYRFADDQHLDLQDFLTNHGAVRLKGGLNLFAKLLGKPGKMDTKGDMVNELYDKGERDLIHDYCLSDTLDTYFVFLRSKVLTGDLTLENEQKIVEEAKNYVKAYSEQSGYLKKYLENFGEWKPDLE